MPSLRQAGTLTRLWPREQSRLPGEPSMDLREEEPGGLSSLLSATSRGSGGRHMPVRADQAACSCHRPWHPASTPAPRPAGLCGGPGCSRQAPGCLSALTVGAAQGRKDEPAGANGIPLFAVEGPPHCMFSSPLLPRIPWVSSLLSTSRLLLPLFTCAPPPTPTAQSWPGRTLGLLLPRKSPGEWVLEEPTVPGGGGGGALTKGTRRAL